MVFWPVSSALCLIEEVAYSGFSKVGRGGEELAGVGEPMINNCEPIRGSI